MFKVLVAGAGKIGSLIACLLANTNDYEVFLVDTTFSGDDIARLLKANPAPKTKVLDVKDIDSTVSFITENHIDALISSLPFFLNIYLAKAAKIANTHYFDLTEDVKTTEEVQYLGKDATKAFVSQCGLAPGFISIVANSIMQGFDTVQSAKLRVGALPQNTSNALLYALTWSTDGLINEYSNPGRAIEAGHEVQVYPLEGLEQVDLDGDVYEAFNTSGGLGSLTALYQDKIQTLNYKTLRYPGHCEKMQFLMHELRLQEDKPLLKRILERALPKTYQDVVVIYVSVEGHKNGIFLEENYSHKIYPQTISGLYWSAIQVSTASSMCVIVDTVLHHPTSFKGIIYQESFSYQDFLANRFGQYYA